MLGKQFLGVVEDTENGIQKYEVESPHPVPVVSVARSPLKAPEDFLVGQSIVFSVEALLREQGDILHGRTACVIGYGKIGRSIADLLHARNVSVKVYDTDPVKRIEALSHGFIVTSNLEKSLFGSKLIFCATGNNSLGEGGFKFIENGAYIATVTSSEDELDTMTLQNVYSYKHISDYITLYRSGSQYFYLMNRGQAVNFIHQASVGHFIYLIQAEILTSLALLTQKRYQNGVVENAEVVRRQIATLWDSAFG